MAWWLAPAVFIREDTGSIIIGLAYGDTRTNHPHTTDCKILHDCFVPLFLEAFENLRKATISFVMSARLEQLRSHCTDFDET